MIFTILSSASIGTIIMSPLYEFSWSRQEYFKFHIPQKPPASSLFDSSSLSTLSFSIDNQTHRFNKVISRKNLAGSEIDTHAQSHSWHPNWPFFGVIYIHLFPRFFFFGAILSTYLAIFVEFGIRKGGPMTEPVLKEGNP